MLDGGKASVPKHAQARLCTTLGKIPTVHIAFADVTVVEARPDYQLVAWEGKIVRGSVWRPWLARSRVPTVGHQADVLFSTLHAVTSAGSLHVAVNRCFFPHR